MKKDYLIAVIAGFFTGLFLLPSLSNIEIGGSTLKVTLPVIISVLWIIGLWVGKLLGRVIPVIYQFAKFLVVGFLNTSIDFGVLNLISILTGLTGGFLIGGVNVPGFILAATNSYFWNKFWVFSHRRQPGEKVKYDDFLTFAAVVVVGLLINGGIVILLTTYINPLLGLSAGRWLNVAKACATAIALFWNFLGMKFLVFKK